MPVGNNWDKNAMTDAQEAIHANGKSQVDRLKEQRDRFIAFAFAGAEVLFELKNGEEIVYCAGTTELMFGSEANGFKGQSFMPLVYRDDQMMLRELMKRMETTGRMDRVVLRMQGAEKPFRCVLSGIIFPDRPTQVYITASRVQGTDLRQGRSQPVQEEVPHTKEDFAAMAEQRIREGAQFGEDYQMTLIDLADASLGDRMEPEEAQKMVQNVESYLRAWSVGGNSVGMLEGNKFGVIHDKNFKPTQVADRIGEIAALFDPSGQAVEVKAATMELDRSTLTQEDISKALVYTINRFVEEGGEDFAVKSLSESYTKALDETLVKVNAFRETIGSDNFVLVYQPIVELKGWAVHHYEALARMVQDDRLFLPARFIGFAEEFGVVNELDLMVVKKAFQALRDNKVLRPNAEIAINLSGKSISHEGFVQQLLLMLVENRDILPRVMFELTESSELKDLDAANKILQKIRSFGCEISIDDFGAGAAAFQYLKALQVDFVKIDGSYILDAFKTRHGRPFLKAIAQLSKDMGIRTIGEMVEDAATMWLLRDVGVDYGQGYFFGRPQPNVADFTLSARPEAER